jgi:hypothetical protein
VVPSNASTSARFIDPDRWTRERAAVGDQHARLAPRPPDPSADWRDRIQQRLELGDVMTVAAVRSTASGMPVASVRTWC